MSQEINKLSVLKVLKLVSKPYVFIDDVKPHMNIHSKEFTSVFEQLVEYELISSTQSLSCGLEMSGDGLPAWSGVNIKITDKGNLVLNPIPWYKKPNYLITIILALLAIASSHYLASKQNLIDNKPTQIEIDTPPIKRTPKSN